MTQNLNKRYGLPTAICMVIGIVIGSGIFFKTEAVLKTTGGNVLTGVFSLIIIGLIMFFCEYSFSILAGKYGKMNGVVDYAEATCGKKYAFYLGWFMTFIYTPALTSVLGFVSAMYFGSLFGFTANSGETMTLAALFLIVDAFLNAVSPKLAGKTQISTTVIKLIPLILMAIVGIFHGLTSGQLLTNFAPSFHTTSPILGSLCASVVSLSFAFEGWILVTSINSELKNAKRNLPLALIWGSIAVVAIYVFYYLGICGAISIDDLMAHGSTYAFKQLFGNIFGTLLTVFITISCLGTMNGLMMANSRNMYSLAIRGNGPKVSLFSHVDKTTNMPINSTFLASLLSIVWLVYYFGANLSNNWFGLFSFDSSELVVITMYAMYIPIFCQMFHDTELVPWKRYLLPALSIFSCLFLIGCAFYAHGIVKFQQASLNGTFAFPVLFYLILTFGILYVGKFFYNK